MEYVVYCNSQSAIDLSKNSMYHARTKHIDVKYHWICEQVENESLQVKKIHTSENPADMFTKWSAFITNTVNIIFTEFIPNRLVIAWNSLKSLKLDTIELDDDDIVNLLSGCPALEVKLLFGGFRRVEITSPNLKRLTLAGHMKPHYHGNEESLEIIAPHIQHLEISGDLVLG
ncbi:putative F-box/LRR-repeat protein At5g02700 [Nicotiana sylvestris]|uniref:putative F-box/LRR-repeat protein At5g02700 n=1 Tax=Nicotiana sylvestris TaxID=4096 RepID=UPI00388CE5A0